LTGGGNYRVKTSVEPNVYRSSASLMSRKNKVAVYSFQKSHYPLIQSRDKHKTSKMSSMWHKPNEESVFNRSKHQFTRQMVDQKAIIHTSKFVRKRVRLQDRIMAIRNNNKIVPTRSTRHPELSPNSNFQ